ncbi:MAG TPA: (Fe-S)-binding protein [Solirubrobacteraceae bacterium]|jgi:glycolate oxidase iron-sulfur subunit|nr:(Fe-S)-binding protein [Solirubrobacteraceae bacterium]
MSGFDEHRPPEQALVDDCVHCGFCLDSCPTYVLAAEEADSPRGRIVLIDEALKPEGSLSDELVSHFDSCLGCLACVSACPSGVQYDKLIHRVRPQIERHHHRPGPERALRLLLFETLPYPKRLRQLWPLLAASRRLGVDRLPERVAVLAKVAPRVSGRRAPDFNPPLVTPAVGTPRGRVVLLLGCVQRVFFSEVHRATIDVLAAEGFEVVAPTMPDCCGALELHAGEEEQGMARAEATIASFSEYGELDAIIVNSAGCGAAMKEYGELLRTPAAEAFSARVMDVSELLASVEPRAERGPVPLKVVYHDACHLAHGQGIRSAPRELLAAIPSLELLEVAAEPDVCCGSAGIYNIVQPHAAAELGVRKARNLLDSGAEAIAAGNPGCTAQLARHLRELGRPLPIHHTIELLARSIAAAH